MRSSISLSKKSKITTATVLVILAAIFVYWLPGARMNGFTPNVNLVILLAGTLILLSAYIFKPRYLLLTEDKLVVRCVLFVKEIPLNEVDRVEDFAPYRKLLNIRRIGIGGLFGWFGRFWNQQLGGYVAIMGSQDNAFVVHLRTGHTYVLSCDDKVEMMQSIQERIL